MEATLPYLEHQEYPEDDCTQPNLDLRKRGPDFTLKDGMLYNLGSRKNFWKLPHQWIFDKETLQRNIQWDRSFFFQRFIFNFNLLLPRKVSLPFDTLRK